MKREITMEYEPVKIWKDQEACTYKWQVISEGHLKTYTGGYDPTDIMHACRCDLVTACFTTLDRLPSKKQWEVFDQLYEMGRFPDPIIQPYSSKEVIFVQKMAEEWYAKN